MPDRPTMKPREMLAWTLLYAGTAFLLLALISTAVPWVLWAFAALACFASFCAGAQLIAWADTVYDEAKRDDR